MNRESDEGTVIEMTIAELISYIEDTISTQVYIFKLANIHEVYENCLNDLGHGNISINRTRSKQSLLDYFKPYGVIEQTVGKNVMLAFKEGMCEH